MHVHYQAGQETSIFYSLVHHYSYNMQTHGVTYESLNLPISMCRYREVIMGTPTVTNQNTTPVQASSSSNEIRVLATPRRYYYLETETETSTFTFPIEETCQSVSSQTVF